MGDPITYKVTETEVSRRQASLTDLQNRCETLKLRASQSPAQSSSVMRNELMGASSSKRRVFGETAETEGQSNQSVYDMQQQKMQDQDQRLGQISDQVTRLNRVGKDISSELDEHHRLLDDTSTKLERTGGRVDQEAVRIDKIKVEASTTSCWLLICVLFIIIIVLAILNLV